MRTGQQSFTDVEYSNRRHASKREAFLTMMDQTIPWAELVALIEPFYPNDRHGRKAKPIEVMLRMYFLQVWFNLSDEAVEDGIYDSYAMRTFMGLDFTVEQVPDATTLLHFRHLLDKHTLGKAVFDKQTEIFEANGWVMRGGSIVDATIIAAPSSTKNRAGGRDPEMHQTRKGNQWYFGMKAHIGVDAGSGYVHTLTVTAANMADIDQTVHLVRDDDHVVYADAGYQGIDKRVEVTGDAHLSTVEFKVAARKQKIKAMPVFDQGIESRKASIRSKVEHPFLIVKRDFGFTKTRYRGLAKNLNRLYITFACVNILKRARAVAIMAAA
jgi:IS5 family transposase